MQLHPNGGSSGRKLPRYLHADATWLSDAELYALDQSGKWPSKKYAKVFRKIGRQDDGRLFDKWFYRDKEDVGTFATEDEAYDKLRETLRKRGRGQRVIVPTKVRFPEPAKHWWEGAEGKLRPNTRRQYRDALDLLLVPRFGEWFIQAIDADAISELIRDLEKEGLHTVDPSRDKRGLGESAIDNYLKPLRGIMALAVRRHMIEVNPFDHLIASDRPKRAEKKEQYEWSPAALQSLLEASRRVAAKKTSKYDYTTALTFAAVTGERCGEVVGANWPDFDVDRSIVRVRQQHTRYGYAPPKRRAGVREIPIPSDLRAMLIELKLAAKDANGPIFASQEGTPLSGRNLAQRGFEAARDEAKLPAHLTFHDLRHAAASRMIGAGLDVVTVARVLGHEDPSVTMRVYAHLFDRVKSDVSRQGCP